MNMLLSENFKLWEFVNSETALRFNIRNNPNWQQVMALQNLCRKVLQPLRDKFGKIVISSGYRCEALNTLVRGVGDSQHLRGEAADIHIPNMGTGLEYFDFIRDHTDFDQLLFEYNRNGARWIHVSCKMNAKANRYMAIPNYKVL